MNFKKAFCFLAFCYSVVCFSVTYILFLTLCYRNFFTVYAIICFNDFRKCPQSERENKLYTILLPICSVHVCQKCSVQISLKTSFVTSVRQMNFLLKSAFSKDKMNFHQTELCTAVYLFLVPLCSLLDVQNSSSTYIYSLENQSYHTSTDLVNSLYCKYSDSFPFRNSSHLPLHTFNLILRL